MSGRFLAEFAEQARDDLSEALDNVAQTISTKLIGKAADTEEANLDRTLATEAKNTERFTNTLDKLNTDTEDTYAASAEHRKITDALQLKTPRRGPETGQATGTASSEAQLFSRSGARSNADVVAHGSEVPMTQEAVASYAARAGVDLSGVDVHVISDEDEIRYLDLQGACACTPSELGGAQIRFGPASFADEETLVATIAHEHIHVLQLRSGTELSTGSIGDLEAEAYASERPALRRFHGGQA
jgi:hypothetical protein